jgi:hypothetical protein
MRGENNMAEEEPKLVSKTALEKAFKGLKRISRGFDSIKSLAEMMADAEDDTIELLLLFLARMSRML